MNNVELYESYRRLHARVASLTERVAALEDKNKNTEQKHENNNSNTSTELRYMSKERC